MEINKFGGEDDENVRRKNSSLQRHNVQKGPKRKNTKHRLVKKFLGIVFSIVFLFLISVVLLAMGYNLVSEKDLEENQTNTENTTQNTDTNTQQEEEEPDVPVKTNVAVFGVDKGGTRTDVIFVVSFDSQTKKISIVSVPRDTRVKMTDEIIAGLEERDRYIPSGGVCKINEVHAYAGDGYRNEYSVMQLEDLLSIDIDYYVKVDTEGFRELVDAIGGVDFYVEERLYYNDPYQDLYIDLQPGMQHLDGDKAEQLVRFREGYAQKDLARIQVQQDFLKALLQKITSTSTILLNLPSLITTCYKYVETDFALSDALKYVQYIPDIDVSNMVTETIPGVGGAYFDHDPEGTRELVDRVFYSTAEDEPAQTEENQENGANGDSKQYSIEVANGGDVNGLAGRTADKLEADGYQVDLVTTYNGEREEQTRILVSETGMGEDLISYFEDARVEVAPSQLTDGTEIKIILGLGER